MCRGRFHNRRRSSCRWGGEIVEHDACLKWRATAGCRMKVTYRLESRPELLDRRGFERQVIHKPAVVSREEEKHCSEDIALHVCNNEKGVRHDGGTLR